MANLDLLVTSDTGPAHLAGALGRPIFVALSDSPDWRWTYEGATTPWYPTMRLFRQETRGDWAGVFERIAAEVAPLAAAVSAGSGASR
jgi:ADP-heptose:LPS heptosyltransferase